MPDGGYPQGPPGPPGLLGVRPGMPIPQPQGPVVSLSPTRSAFHLHADIIGANIRMYHRDACT